MAVEFSIVIPTFNRSGLLLRQLNRCFEIDYPAAAFEIIVVDDGSTDGTSEAIRGLSRVRSVISKNQGAPTARNLGARIAQGEILCFIDDDCFPAPDFLRVLRSFWDGLPDKRIQAVGGSIVGAADTYFGKFSDYLDAYGAEPTYLTRGCTSNLSIKRQAFFDVGGFNPELKGAEDVALCLELLKANALIYYLPTARIFHHHVRDSFWSLVVRTWKWGKEGEAHLLVTYPDFFLTTPKEMPYKNALQERRSFRFVLASLKHAYHTTIQKLKDQPQYRKLSYFPFLLILNLISEVAVWSYLRGETGSLAKSKRASHLIYNN